MPDPLFRQRLRTHYADLKAQARDMEPGAARFDIERAISATSRLYGTLYGESLDPLHAGPHPERKEGPATPRRATGPHRPHGGVG